MADHAGDRDNTDQPDAPSPRAADNASDDPEFITITEPVGRYDTGQILRVSANTARQYISAGVAVPATQQREAAPDSEPPPPPKPRADGWPLGHAFTAFARDQSRVPLDVLWSEYYLQGLVSGELVVTWRLPGSLEDVEACKKSLEGCPTPREENGGWVFNDVRRVNVRLWRPEDRALRGAIAAADALVEAEDATTVSEAGGPVVTGSLAGAAALEPVGKHEEIAPVAVAPTSTGTEGAVEGAHINKRGAKNRSNPMMKALGEIESSGAAFLTIKEEWCAVLQKLGVEPRTTRGYSYTRFVELRNERSSAPGAASSGDPPNSIIR